MNNVALPALEDIAKLDPDQVRKYTPRLNSSAMLILGANPWHGQRNSQETDLYRKMAGALLQTEYRSFALMCREIVHGLYPKKFRMMERKSIANFLQKYRHFHELMNTYIDLELERFDDLRRLEIELNKQLSVQRRQNDYLEKTPVELHYYQYAKAAVDEPFLIIVKRKIPARLAMKIPNKMFEEYFRSINYSKKRGDDFLEKLCLDDGNLGDIFGIQIVTYTPSESIRIKEFIDQNDNIEVLKLESHHEKAKENYQDYQAIHVKGAWNPKPIEIRYKPKGERVEKVRERPIAYVYERHPPALEISVITAADFFKANFHVANYYRRMIAQETGIVLQQLSRNQILSTVKFNTDEQRWRDMVMGRIIELIPSSYGSHEMRPFSGK